MRTSNDPPPQEGSPPGMAQPSSAPSPAEPVPAEYDVLCESCGYSLVGLMVNRCPECGQEFNPNELPLARVPWLYRRRLGYVDSYLRTIAFILLRPRQFARELSRPVRISRDDAWRFRRITAFLAVASLVLSSLWVAYLRIPAAAWQEKGVYPGAATTVLLVPILLWYFLLLCTDMPTFIWRGLPHSPDDLTPLHHYTVAPLFLVAVLAPLAAAAVLYHYYAMIAAAVALWFSGLLLWTLPMSFMRATGASLGRALLLGLYLPIHWLMLLFAGWMIYIAALIGVVGME